MSLVEFRTENGGAIVRLNNGTTNAYSPALLPDMILRRVAGDVLASDMLNRGALLESAAAAAKGIAHEVSPSEQVEATALERVIELTGLVPEAFRAAKRNRVEAIRARYQTNGRLRNEEFLDIWFSPPAQRLLREASVKF